MLSISRLSLAQRFVLTGVLLSIAPIVVIGLMAREQVHLIAGTAEDNADRLSRKYLTQASQMEWNLVAAAQDDLANPLHFAEGSLNAYGLKVSPKRRVTWRATNEETQDTKTVRLPLVTIGRRSIRGTGSGRQVIDQVQDVTGASCTLFERMDAAGDMLRISTSLLNGDGKRAVGTYIPAVSRDGKPNAVIGSILAGNQYVERTTVLGKPYLAAYELLRSQDHGISGMLCIAVPQATEAERIKGRLAGLRNDDGEVFALDTLGENSGNYLFSTRPTVPEGLREQLLQDSMRTAPASSEVRYLAPDGRAMVVQVRWFAPWNWALGVAVPERLRSVELSAMVNRFRAWIAGVMVLSILACLLIWERFGALVSRSLRRTARQLQAETNRLVEWSKRISGPSQKRSGEVSFEGSALAQTTRLSHEIQRAAKNSSERMVVALDTARSSEKSNRAACDQVASMRASMNEMAAANNSIRDLMKSVDEIAFQSRILALNARIEAARAGEAGVSFAVVADQFGSLAERCADAAGRTAEFLTGSAKSTREGVDRLTELDKAVQQIAANTSAIGAAISEVHRAADEQTTASAGIGTALQTVERMMHQNARKADSRPALVSELAQMAGSLHAHTSSLRGAVEGKKRKHKVRAGR